jgi:hypothetical protein
MLCCRCKLCSEEAGMLTPPLHTLTVDERGEAALALLPAPSGPANPVYIYGAQLRASDAWTGTTFRASIEYHCVNLGNSMTLEAPANDRSFARLCDLLGPLPETFHLTRNAPGAGRGLALLPALRIADETDLDSAATVIHYRAGGFGEAAARTVSTALAVFADNALTHASTSSIDVVTTIAFDPEANSLQIVSTDLGPDLVEPEHAERFLVSVQQRAAKQHSNLAHLIQASTRRGLSGVLVLASGPGRLRWSSNGISSATTYYAPGFTQALTINGVR